MKTLSPSILVILAAGLALLMTPVRAVEDRQKILTISSPACPAGARWKIAMLEFFANSDGGKTSRGNPLNLYRAEVQNFVNEISQASMCSVSADVDVWDMEEAIYPVADEPPQGVQKVFIDKGYDVVMYRYPDHGQRVTFLGRAGARWIQFPVTLADANLAYGAPWITLIWHEWLHAAVSNLAGRSEQGLPPDDVHFEFWKSDQYTQIPDAWTRAMAFYRDLTGGRVLVAGRLTGFTAKDLSNWGTPARPINHAAILSLNIELAGPDILLSWPAGINGYTIEKSSELGIHSWTPVVLTPSVMGDMRYLKIPITQAFQFYRLRTQ